MLYCALLIRRILLLLPRLSSTSALRSAVYQGTTWCRVWTADKVSVPTRVASPSLCEMGCRIKLCILGIPMSTKGAGMLFMQILDLSWYACGIGVPMLVRLGLSNGSQQSTTDIPSTACLLLPLGISMSTTHLGYASLELIL